jgi:16S rRNA (cytidine1402-2'-O)-methyltransferase
MPTVSDPGYGLVAEAARAGIRVSALPGPSAVLTALAVSGLPTDRFACEGFPPRKPGERRGFFAALAAEERTLVFFEAPSRIAATLADLAATFGPERPAAVCRELTKLHEEVVRGPLGELARWAEDGVRGEIALVVGGATRRAVAFEDAVAQVLELVRAGERLKAAASEVSAGTGHSSRELYQAALALKD